MTCNQYLMIATVFVGEKKKIILEIGKVNNNLLLVVVKNQIINWLQLIHLNIIFLVIKIKNRKELFHRPHHDCITS